MWYDEVATYEPAHLSDPSRTLQFFTQGYDTPSPIPALLVKASILLIGDTDVNNRLVFIGGFLLMCTFMYGFVARRYSAGYAAASILFLAGIPFRQYAVDMRAYAFLGCGAAGMLYFWQGAVSGKSRAWNLAGLWLSFAFAVLSHVFGLFLFLPFAIAELRRTGLSARRADKAIWAVLLTAPLSLLLLAPAILAARAHYQNGFWSRPTFANLLQSYSNPLLLKGLVLAVAAVGLAFGARFLSKGESKGTPAKPGFTGPEWSLIWALACLPIFGIIGGLILLHVYHPRYVSPVILGIDLLLIAILARISSFRSGLGYAVAALFLIYAVVAQHKALGMIAKGEYGSRLIENAHRQPWIEAICESPLPVLGGTPHDFFAYQHYAPACMQSKLFYATDLARARSAPDLFTAEQNMNWFAKFLPLKVVSLQSFLAGHREFLVFSAHHVGQTEAGWFLPAFEEGDYGLKVIAKHLYVDPPYEPVTVWTVRRR